MAKQYKNVYTILEKVKKGEIKSHYKEGDGLFGKINFYRKPDLIKPYLHYLDEDRLGSMMDGYVRDQENVKKIFNKMSKHAEYKKIDENQKPDFGSFFMKFTDNYKKFPKHIIRDIHKMYYNRIEKLEFEERTNANYSKYKFLEKANNPVGKIMSEGSNFKSAIFARNIMTYLLGRLTIIDFIEPDQANNIKNNLSGNSSDFDDKDIENAIDTMLNSSAANSQLMSAINEAQELCQEMDEAIPEDIQEQMFDSINQGSDSSIAGKMSPDYIRQVAQKLEEVKLSMNSLKEKIKKLLDKSLNYFSSQKKTVHEDFFNSDNIAGLEDYELLHPKLRKLFVEDIMIKDTKAVGKIDIYVDISGSMDSSCGVKNEKGQQIRKIDFCKSFVTKLEQLGMLNDVYVFDTKVKKYKKDPISISFMDGNGGTKINYAIETVIQNGNNALIITDAEDHCSLYSDKVFFIGVEGARFNHFDNAVLKQYVEKDQIVIFDGQTISKVDNQGYIIK